MFLGSFLESKQDKLVTASKRDSNGMQQKKAIHSAKERQCNQTIDGGVGVESLCSETNPCVELFLCSMLWWDVERPGPQQLGCRCERRYGGGIPPVLIGNPNTNEIERRNMGNRPGKTIPRRKDDLGTTWSADKGRLSVMCFGTLYLVASLCVSK